MSTLPRLLETYEEARLLLEAKGWGIAKAAEHLSEMRELARFNISQASLSRRTAPGSKFPCRRGPWRRGSGTSLLGEEVEFLEVIVEELNRHHPPPRRDRHAPPRHLSPPPGLEETRRESPLTKEEPKGTRN